MIIAAWLPSGDRLICWMFSRAPNRTASLFCASATPGAATADSNAFQSLRKSPTSRAARLESGRSSSPASRVYASSAASMSWLAIWLGS